jgi:hypothetical protein
MNPSMSPVTKKWLAILQKRFGVGFEFAEHLVPFLERFAAQEPTNDEWEQMLRAIAAAYRSCDPSSESDTLDEVRTLLGQFVTEMKKLDETLKVLSVYMERVRQRIYRPDPGRTLH